MRCLCGVHICDPLDDEEATAFPLEKDEAMREWRQELPEQTRRAIFPIHTNIGHPQNSTLAKMITYAGGSEVIKCANRASECPGLVSGVLCQFQEPDSSMILCWLMCISGN